MTRVPSGLTPSQSPAGQEACGEEGPPLPSALAGIQGWGQGAGQGISGIMAGWGGPGSGLNRVLPSPPGCGLERGSFPCSHPQGRWWSLSQWERGLGFAPLTPLWSCRPLPGTQDSPGASYHPLHKSTSQWGPGQDGQESRPVLLQVGNQVRAERQAGLKRVPDSGPTCRSPCLFLPRDPTPPSPSVPLPPPELQCEA